MKELLETVYKVVHEKGFVFEFDHHAKSVLLHHKKDGFRYLVCAVERLPKELGFEFKDTTSVAKLISQFLNSLTVDQNQQEVSQQTELNKKLSSVENLKEFFRQSVFEFIDNSDSPVLTDTLVGMFLSLATELTLIQLNQNPEEQ